MKRILLMIVAVALSLTQCRKPSVENPSTEPTHDNTVSMTITAGPGRTDIFTTGGILWSESDKIYVSDGNAWLGCLEIGDGVGSSIATFTGNVSVVSGNTYNFHFFYLGTGSFAQPTVGSTDPVTIDFSSQDIYADANDKLVNASNYHIGYDRVANVKVSGSTVSGINVRLRSKIAVAYLGFKKDGTSAYDGELKLSGTSSAMTVGAGGAIEVKLVKSHPYVDLGLPSRTLWAACNIGVVNDSPDQYGDYYRWGDKTCVTSTGIDLTINNCPWHTTGSNDKTGCTKYVPSDKVSYAQDGNPDGKTVLDPEDDVVIDKWGNKWCLPTEAQLRELLKETKKVYGTTATLDNGETVTMSVAGAFFISKVCPDRYIFLPKGGVPIWKINKW